MFFLLSFASGPSQPDQCLLIYSSLGCGTSVPTPQSLQMSHSPYFFFAFVSAYISCADFGFQSIISRRAMAFTTAPFTCWLRHQVHIRGSFAISTQVLHLGPRTTRPSSRVLHLGPRTTRPSSRVVGSISCSSPKHNAFDQSGPLTHPTQSPELRFVGFSLVFWFFCLLIDRCNGLRLFLVFYLVSLVLGI